MVVSEIVFRASKNVFPTRACQRGCVFRTFNNNREIKGFARRVPVRQGGLSKQETAWDREMAAAGMMFKNVQAGFIAAENVDFASPLKSLVMNGHKIKSEFSEYLSAFCA
jgi:hypothetical protein